MRKIIALIVFLVVVSNVIAISDRNDYKVINPISTESVMFSFVGITLSGYVCTDFNRLPSSTSSDFRDSVYGACEENAEGKEWTINGLGYDSSNQLIGLSCCISEKEKKTTQPIKTGYKGVGESCSYASECGSACDGFVNSAFISFSPRCIDDGDGKICFCGESKAAYASICRADDDCGSNEICYYGGCTISNTEASGNTVDLTKAEMIKQDDGKYKCSDGTMQNMCSKNAPYYCQQGLTLVSKPEICGCPSGQKLDTAGGLLNIIFSCCNQDGSNCQNGGICTNGIEVKANCPDGSEAVIKRCENNQWESYASFCKVSEESKTTSWLIILIVVVIILVIAIVAIVVLVWLYKRYFK